MGIIKGCFSIFYKNGMLSVTSNEFDNLQLLK